MPLVAAEAELRTLTECQYISPVETLLDLQRVRSVFTDLRLYVDFYRFPNKEKRRLVYLAGTVPVHYDGKDYNMPVCVWIHEHHPASRPRCYVCPSSSMVINPSCPCVDASGNVTLDALSSWTQGVSDLAGLVSEMRRAFQEDTPLYARPAAQAPPPAGRGQSLQRPVSSGPSRTPHGPGSQWEQSEEARVRRSYTEELLGIDFSAAPPPTGSNPFLSPPPAGETLTCLKVGHQPLDPTGDPHQENLSRKMEPLRLDRKSSRDQKGSEPDPTLCSQEAQDGAPAGVDQMASCLPAEQAAMFSALLTLEGRTFSPADALEAVRLSRDLPSALKFLSHRCPICQEQVSFSKVITMTHCSCSLCQACFKAFFSAAIKEKSIEQLVCPQCGRPEVRGQGRMEEAMEYFNLLDTQIRHFLPPQIHELFQTKLRDRALREMPSFRWCAHCSFGLLHEAHRLRMDCPSCRKSTCSQCRAPWSPQHQGRSCQEFRAWQQQQQPDQTGPLLRSSSIVCPQCQLIFSLSRGGCLHFTCSQCQHQFCGGCKQAFSLGAACGFSLSCGSKGLHAHHPRDCLYHLRDWTAARLHLLLQFHRVSPSLLEPAGGGDEACSVLELREDGARREEACGRPAKHRGYCLTHYKERLVELVNRCGADPAALFSPAEMTAELRRWHVAVPTRRADETESVFAQRLRRVLTSRLPLRTQPRSAPTPLASLCPLPSEVAAAPAPPPRHLLSD